LAPECQSYGGIELLNPAANVLGRLYGQLNAVGFISENDVSVNGVKRIAKEDLKNIDFDLILVTGEDTKVLITNMQSDFVKILKEVKSLGIDENKVVRDRVVCIPNFTLEKYKKLRHSRLSILSMNCFGGLCYHRFGLPFFSPIINMYTYEKEFIKFLQDPMQNVKAEIKYVRTERNEALNIDYPVYKIGEVEWSMNHYGDANVAYRKWVERSFRINWFNLFVTMYTEKPEIAAEFDKLPFAKKVCFVPFKSNLDSAYYVDSSKYANGDEFWRIANSMASGSTNEYDMWDMLLYGKKTPLIIQKT
jgi:uncharacterized protein (DUF1919 family)